MKRKLFTPNIEDVEALESDPKTNAVAEILGAQDDVKSLINFLLEKELKIKTNDKGLAETGKNSEGNYALVTDILGKECFLINNPVSSINPENGETTKTTPYFHIKSGNPANSRQGTGQYSLNGVEKNGTSTPKTLDQIES